MLRGPAAALRGGQTSLLPGASCNQMQPVAPHRQATVKPLARVAGADGGQRLHHLAAWLTDKLNPYERTDPVAYAVPHQAFGMVN